jgi:Pyridoxamine 5'-phosphate oxidase
MTTSTDDLATWADLEIGAPSMAASGRALLEANGEAGALLATVRGDAPPRIHPVTVAVVDGGLFVFLLDSAKRRDLAEDGRFALHGYQDPAAPREFSVRGHARLVPAGPLRDEVAAGWKFEVDDTYWLFELRLASAILGERTADEWPPRYTRWSATAD